MFKQMQYFISVVETQSFTKAAEECYISQSAISQQIKSLERELDVKLLKRTKKSFSLTPAGEYFYEHCKEIIDEVNLLCQKTKDIEDDESILKIGYLRSYPGKELRNTIMEFSSLYNDVSIDLYRGNHEELYNYLVSGEASLVVSDQRRAFHDDYINYHLLHMDCYVEISTNNPLSQKEYIDVKDLNKLTCILVASKDQEEIEQEFYENIIGLKCHYIFVRDIDEGRIMVSINRGFMPVEHTRKHEDKYQGVKSIPLYRNNKQLQRNYCAFWKKDRSNYYIEEFADLLRKKIRESHNA
jgi:DNA-binding transcriptional LysR family regulator